ncbi:maleylpyruvate isomerase N-terminal domain-containing protein [Actinoplanes sp. LDG1-06]|uniref:Maleylpyruvate isomerase N-terminal domain-containing protein n=1 Tax=Paractinoplanes ovalisporus TaxID=2810368 RepID=A0ABS2AA14_9ACTN|nr:maleylpyruvate isomerase N-terminal domain-containing protein [Actinoplanes ovalisporus]MBM2616595.1 maleylpyruvate isomerase N-terminal domain-containing protein [Actinoplanes ovalisporus]
MSAAATLGELWAVWASYGSRLSAEQWEAPTRLEPWTVRALFAHTAQWPRWLAYVATQTRDTPPSHPRAADLLRAFNAPDGVATLNRGQTADRAVDDATKLTVEQMTAAFAEVGPPALEAAGKLGDTVVNYLGTGTMPMPEVLGIGIVEATVHLLDLQRALGETPAVPSEGLAHTARVLAEMASPVEFVEALTGRGELGPVLT